MDYTIDCGMKPKEINANPQELELWELIQKICPEAMLRRYSKGYLSGIAKEHCDFIRFKFTDRAKWFSIGTSGVYKEWLKDSRANLAENTKVLHWQFYIEKPDDILAFEDWIKAAYEIYAKM